MSATRRGRDRNVLDDYPTPGWCVHRLLEKYHLPGGNWLEPTAGFGNIICAANQVRQDIQWTANDIQARNRERIKKNTDLPDSALHTYDIRQVSTDWLRYFAVYLSNPPYDLALDVAQKGIEAGIWTVLLLRLAWLASERRNTWLQAHPPDVCVIPNRPRFLITPLRETVKLKDGSTRSRNVGGDATDYGWAIWPPYRTAGPTTLMLLNTTSLQERQASHLEMVARSRV